MAAMINTDFRPVAGFEVAELAEGGAKAPVAAGDTAATGTFAQALSEAVGRVEGYRVQSDQSVSRFLNGEEEEVHKVAVAAQQAELSFDLFLQVKNKVVQAYQEVMRMQL